MQGILLLDKEQNKTSRDMVNELNHIFDMKKIGHTGTLDPLATGVLVMCIGKYTKLVDMLSSLKKEYVAQIKLGIMTDTLDITGNILKEESFIPPTDDKIKKVLNSLKGKIIQTIPKYSAKKINGKKLYEYARNGEDIVLPQNEIEVYNISLLDNSNGIITFKAEVSKGTYIRSLIEMICERLGIIGTMSSLVRTKQGKFTIEDAYSIDEVKKGLYKILKAKDVLGYPVYDLSDIEYNKVKNGNKISIKIESNYVILLYNNEEVAIYEKDNDLYKAKIMLI